MKFGKKKIAFGLVFFVSAFAAFCQPTPKRPEAEKYSWRILENAQVAFDSAKYSEAMNLANQARESRKAEITWEVFILEKALSPLAVRRAGESFADVLKILAERDENNAIELINKYLRRYGTEFYDDSISNLVSWIREKTAYPEADFLIGKIYQIEGEYKTAYSFYEKARQEREYLDIPNSVYDILYAMVDLARDSKNDEEYEQALLLILDSDKYFKDEVLKTSFIRILNADKPTDVDRFFKLFRANTSNTLEALYELGNIYEKQGRREESLKCSALASIEAFTHIYEAICERDNSYEYTTYSDFLMKCSNYTDVLEWGYQNHVWETMFLMASRVNDSGKTKIAKQFFYVMSKSMPDSYWRAKALNKIN